jgi:hypothetical protein
MAFADVLPYVSLVIILVGVVFALDLVLMRIGYAEQTSPSAAEDDVEILLQMEEGRCQCSHGGLVRQRATAAQRARAESGSVPIFIGVV